MMYKNYISLTKEIFTNYTVLLLVGLLAMLLLSYIPLFVFDTKIVLLLPYLPAGLIAFVFYKLRNTKYV